MTRYTQPKPAMRPFLVFLLFTALGILYSWPLVTRMHDAIPYGYDADPAYATALLYMGDHLQYYYHLGLLKHAALGHIDWFTNPLEFTTEYQPQWFTSYGLPLSLLYLPFALFSMPFAYNTLVLISLGLGGLSMYLWVTQLTKNRAAGLVAGVVFNFFPLRLVELFGGHPSGLSIFLFPLTLYFFDRAVANRSAWSSAFAGVCAVTLTVQYNYFTYYLLMFLMVYIPWRLLPEIKSGFKEIIRLAIVGIPFAFGLLGSIWMMFDFKKIVAENTSFGSGRTLGEVSLFSPKLAAIWDTSLGWQVYLGGAMLAALFGLFSSVFSSSKKEPFKWDILLFTILFSISYILAFGTTFDKYVPLYSLFYDYFPYFNFSRSPTKIMIISMTLLSALAGYMTVWVMRKENNRVIWRGAGVIALVATAIDFHPKKDIGLCVLDEGNEVYQYIADTADNKPVLNLPIWPGESSWESIYQYYTIQSGVPMINGYSPLVPQKYTDNIFRPLWPMNSGDVAEKQVQLMRKLNVSYIVFHANAYPSKISAYSPYFAIRRLLASPYLKLVKKNDPLWVFRLTDGSAKPKPEDGSEKVISPIGILFQAEHQTRISGKPVEDKDASNGWTLLGDPKAKNAPDGILNAGPYLTFPSGDYKATFRVKAADNTVDKPVLKLDVAGQQGRVVLASKVLNGTDFTNAGEYQEFTLEYSLANGEAWQIEFRTYIAGPVAVSVDDIYVRFAKTEDPSYKYEAENLQYYSGRLLEEKDASGGEAILSTPGLNPAGIMVFGPGRMFEPGSYRALVRLKAEETESQKPLITIVIISESTRKEMARRDITLNDIGGGGEYKQIPIDFTLSGKEPVEVQALFTGVTKVAVDTIVFEPIR